MTSSRALTYHEPDEIGHSMAFEEPGARNRNEDPGNEVIMMEPTHCHPEISKQLMQP